MDFEQDCGLVFTEISNLRDFFWKYWEKTPQENMKKYQEKGTFIVENHNCVELQLVDKNRVDYLKKSG